MFLRKIQRNTTKQIMGSRCGTLRHVPFAEAWPPTENNLGGPYWERRLAGKGIYADGYSSYANQHNSGGDGAAGWGGVEELRRQAAEAAKTRAARGEAGVELGIFTTVVLVMGVLCCCVLCIVRCAAGGDGGGGRRFASSGSRKPRGRPKVSRRSTVRVERATGSHTDKSQA